MSDLAGNGVDGLGHMPPATLSQSIDLSSLQRVSSISVKSPMASRSNKCVDSVGSDHKSCWVMGDPMGHGTRFFLEIIFRRTHEITTSNLHFQALAHPP